MPLYVLFVHIWTWNKTNVNLMVSVDTSQLNKMKNVNTNGNETIANGTDIIMDEKS